MTATGDLRAEARRIERENAGAVESRVRRQTGRIVTLYRSIAAGLDPEAGAYTLVCEYHGHTIAMDNLRVARWHASDPEGWCEPCGSPDDWEQDETGGWIPISGF